MNKFSKWLIILLLIVFVLIISLTIGEYKITISNVIMALFNRGDSSDINIILNVRLPRVFACFFIGAALSLSGYITQIALKNPLADSSILGVQTGSTTLVLISVLVFPSLSVYSPIFAFIGGMIAFSLTLIISKTTYNSKQNLILSGVAINAFFTSIIGLITIFNAKNIQSSFSYLNGSVANITTLESLIIAVVCILLIAITFYLIPILKLLLLDDTIIFNLGYSPYFYRIIISTFSILLSSISICFVGVISFIGIIVPSISKKIIGFNIKDNIITNILLGALVVSSADITQKIIFNPYEIPVGLIIGIIATPLFIVILRKEIFNA